MYNYSDIALSSLIEIRRIIMKKKILSILMSACILLSFFGMDPEIIWAKNGDAGRIINVVYDDSGSMVRTDGVYIKRWSQAKYAVEVFTAMMGNSDVMNIYPMSKSGGVGLTVQGSDKNRVNKIHDMNARYSNTPFSTVTSAAEDLQNDSSGKEKWLVIITDGAFDDGATPVDTVYEKINEYNSKGIKVVYLAIGENATVLNGDPLKGFYAEKAADGSDVLDKVMKIANQIFTHMIVPQNRITANGNMAQLDVDIPVDKIMIFAQGDNVSIGDVKLNGTSLQATEVENVKYSDVLPENYSEAEVDTTLKGVIATYEASGQPFESGKYEVEVSGAQNIEYYYSPGVEVNCNLLMEGTTVSQDAELYAGNYEVEMDFIDPTTGNTIESELLSDAEFALSVENNGSTQTVNGTKGSVQLTEGEVLLYAEANLPDEVTLVNEKTFKVLPEAKILKLEMSGFDSSYTADRLAEGTVSILLKITDAETGGLLSQEEWENTVVSLDDSGGVQWDVKPGSDISTWVLTPKSQDGSIAGISTGDLTWLVSASYQIGDQYAYGSENLGLSVLAYESDSLIFEVVSQNDSYTLDNLEDEEPIILRAYIENAETKEKEVISETLWDALEIKLNSKTKLNIEYEKGEEVGTYVVHLKYYKGDPLKTASGKVSLAFTAKGTEGEHRYEGTAKTEIDLTKLSIHKWIILVAPKLIMLGILIFIIIGYLAKNRIRTKKLNPHHILNTKYSSRTRIKKKFWSVVIPYKPQKAVVRCSNIGYKFYVPDLIIEATSNSSFKIKNKNINLNTTLFDGRKISSMKELSREKFTYSLEVTSIDPKNNNRKLGRFVFR